MNLALIASSFYPHLGGVEEVVRQLAREHSQHGIKPIVLTNHFPISLPEFEEVEGIPVYRLPFRLPDHLNKGALAKSWVRFQMGRNAVQKATREIFQRHEIELIQIHCVTSSAPYALQAARELKLPVVVSAHGELTMDAQQVLQRSTVMQRALRDSLREADFITACSNQTLEELQKWWGASLAAKSEVTYSGVFWDDFNDDAPERSTPPPALEPQKPYILGIGRLVPQKGFDILLRAFALADLPDFHLVLAGEGGERENLENLARELKIEKQVCFFGRAERESVIALFKNCEFFVLPSRMEPMGIVNLEAMSAGKAVVASRVGGVPELVASDTGILVPQGDAPALGKAMQTLARDEKLREKLGRAGRVRAQQFAWPRVAAQHRAIYDRVLRQRSTP